MTPALASLINAILLVVLGGYGYFTSDTPSMTALIPVIVGIVLLLCQPGIRSQNRVVAHIAVLLTLLILLGLVMPLIGAFKRADTAAIIRVALMLISSVVAMVFFIRNFIANRRSKALGE